MTNARTFLRCFGPAVLLALSATLAVAHEEKHVLRAPLASAPWTTSLLVPRFDPSRGELQEVRVSLRAHLQGSLGVENTSPAAVQAASQFTATVALRETGYGAIAPVVNLADALAAFDGQIDYHGASGRMHAGLVADASSNLVSSRDPVFLTRFVGRGRLQLGLVATPSSRSTPGANLLLSSIQAVSAELEVVYVFGTAVDCLQQPPFTCPPGSQVTVTYTASIPPQYPEWTTSGPQANAPRIGLRKWTPPPGSCQRLYQADIQMRARITGGTLAVENRDPFNSCVASMMLAVDMHVTPFNLPPLLPTDLPPLNGNFTANLTSFDGTVDFGGTSGHTVPLPTFEQTVCRRIIDPTDLRAVTNATPGIPSDDFLIFDHSAISASIASGCGQMTFEDNSRGTLEIQVTYTVCNLPPPVTNSDFAEECLGSGPIPINILYNDSKGGTDVDCSNPLHTFLSSVTPPSAGTVSFLTDLAQFPNSICEGLGVVFTPNPGFAGTATFTYTLGDRNACSDTATVTVTIGQAPTAVDDTVNACRNTPVSINVFANDTGSAGFVCPSALTTAGLGTVSPVGAGTVFWFNDAACVNALCPQRCVRFTPSPFFTGTATFSYTIGAGDCTASAMVSVTVCGTTAGDDVNNFVCSGQTIDIPVTQNDSTTCGTIDCSTIVLPPPVPPGFSLVNCGTASCASCRVRYNSALGPTSGTVSVTYQVGNNQVPACLDTATVTVTVRAPPILANDSATTCSGVPVVIYVLENDQSTAPLDMSTFTLVTQPAQGTATVSCLEGQQRCIVYTPPMASLFGPVSFTYGIRDTNSCMSTAVVTVTVCEVTASDDTGTICTGTTQLFDVLANDTTTCGTLNCTTMQLVAPVPPGFSLSNCGTASCTSCRIQYVAPITPTSGAVSVTYRIGNSSNPACTDTAVLTLNRCNTSANDDTGTMCAGTTQLFNVLVNDTTTCATLNCTTMQLVAPVPPGFSLVSCGTANCTSCRIQYAAPAASVPTTVAVTYRICNNSNPQCCDTGLLTINVGNCLGAFDDSAQTAENCPVNVNFLSNDTGSILCGAIVIGSVSPPTAGTVALLIGGGACAPYPMCPPTCFQFTPAAGFTGSASFTYTITTGTASATATVTINVLPDCDGDCLPDVNDPDECNPSCTSDSILPGGGSLLIYPEFDNRAGSVTLITITNTDDLGPPNPLLVEFVYIGRYSPQGLVDCEEFNRDVSLTPNDTLTLLTDVHNPFQHQGYVYAFAKNAGGQPISHNHLIGNLVHLNGIDNFHWSVNPFVFGSPVAEGALTNLDGDLIRDLNGAEYVMVPDRIQVPRFLGQGDVNPALISELILIPLTGGTQFTSSIDFLIYNDNEQVFSAQASVRCWDKRRLDLISGAFRENFLDTTGDAVDEIVGQPDREAGWFTLNGLVAASNQTSIFNPAILAVLVETASLGTQGPARFAADLPFGVGTQPNGDLLPRTGNGDPSQ